MSGEDWTGVIFGMGVLILSTVILVVVLTQVGRFLSVRQERAADARNAELLEDIRTRVIEVERMLRDVS